MKFAYFTYFAALAMAFGLVGCGGGDGSSDFAAGKAAFELKDLKKAERYFLKCEEAMPDNVDAHVYLARIYLQLGEIESAQKWLAKAEELAAADTDVKLLGAQIAFFAKDNEKAVRLFREVANDGALTPSVRSQGWTGLGVVEMSVNNEPDLARLAFLRAIQADRRNAAAWYHLGLPYRNSFGYYAAALEQLNYFVRLDENASPRVQDTQQKIIPALKEMIARATTERPGVSKRNSAASAEALGKAEEAWKRGNVKQARQNYQDAFDADILSFPAVLGLAKATLKLDPSKAGQQKALEYYRYACELRPSSVSVFLTAGDLAAKLGMHASAVEIYSRAMAANPTSLDAIDGLIRAQRRSGGPKKVTQAYQDYRDAIAAARGGRR